MEAYCGSRVGRVADRTLEHDRLVARRINEMLGHRRAADVWPLEIEAALRRRLDDGLWLSYVGRIRTQLRAAYRWAASTVSSTPTQPS